MLDPFALAALVIVPLAQVPLVLYLARYVELDATARLPRPDRGYVTYGTAAADPGDAAAVCPNCGDAVEAGYAFCGTCAGRIPAVRRRG
jgi:hypothetical protein